ncbi:hypothetical protein BDA96_06G089500 [Sorghum bicolor]|uniref:Uncharacterized protein n=1 Tax=Sorghum bicolor TaxID=4558 RepID=A0A921QQ98_SORBI|nr:hypothetical protein BDA96_06G089500 [Sorghum bicolor]
MGGTHCFCGENTRSNGVGNHGTNFGSTVTPKANMCPPSLLLRLAGPGPLPSCVLSKETGDNSSHPSSRSRERRDTAVPELPSPHKVESGVGTAAADDAWCSEVGSVVQQ